MAETHFFFFFFLLVLGLGFTSGEAFSFGGPGAQPWVWGGWMAWENRTPPGPLMTPPL